MVPLFILFTAVIVGSVIIMLIKKLKQRGG